jgi:hypothetical protein
MAMAVYVDAAVSDDARRERTYGGAVHLTSPTPATSAFAAFARELVHEAFAGHDPEHAQFDMPVAEYAAVLAQLKPRFIHHPESKRHVQATLAERGCDLDATYFDVPRLRTSTSDGYLTTGIAYAWHPHRDTWYSAPMAQLNFWMPVFDLGADNAMAFHPEFFDRAVPNDSARYNYYEWNAKHRATAASNLDSDARPLPGPDTPIDLGSSSVFVTQVGGLIEFSGAQLHSSVPNTSGRTRFSIDFRTVQIDDLRAGRGAANVDSHCTGSSIRDFVRASDLSAMPADVVAQFVDGTEDRGSLVYDGVAATAAG